ncbi:sterol desaturase family protein [Xylophilus ampelinus]|uniref:Sterol desaturase/sphingolipid hydroxylase (Fatty acid hydroxylase superfamily) n=1 Tax=Xylophilus ampelinus TaxID=54067 RepID=A0A318SGR4_9BURK|nr:sterol desaturase family protein [Xylophilus ampelinus]MCS4510353.1 sterol desaturase family protein [Xylophilus ampelinus]PYE78023.1 sterol desaturase/sphingolipid hydroxylase (fatty acid hydroxylase superfamily) [Xylophilus ampelinus]
MSILSSSWHGAIDALSSHLVAPVLAALHLGAVAGDPHEIAEALLIAALQLVLIAGVMRPLESWRPAEHWPDRRLTTVDRHYTLLMLLGLFPLFSFLVLMPFAHLLGGGPAAAEASGLRRWLPWFESHPVAAFAVYYLLYDCVYYWMHRAQHAIPWWWALHSMHHSQRQMSCWSNDRGSYLDGVLQSFILAGVGLAMGVDPSEFALLVLLSELVQNFSHANVALGFGRVGERLLVAPSFHRLHHMLRDPDRPTLHNCNFGQVFPFWDRLFGTALYGEPLRPTGVSDPVVDADNDRGLVAQQWHTLRRFWAAFRRRDGWRPGDVSFGGPGYAPVRDATQAPSVSSDSRAGPPSSVGSKKGR